MCDGVARRLLLEVLCLSPAKQGPLPDERTLFYAMQTNLPYYLRNGTGERMALLLCSIGAAILDVCANGTHLCGRRRGEMQLLCTNGCLDATALTFRRTCCVSLVCSVRSKRHTFNVAQLLKPLVYDCHLIALETNQWPTPNDQRRTNLRSPFQWNAITSMDVTHNKFNRKSLISFTHIF